MSDTAGPTGLRMGRDVQVATGAWRHWVRELRDPHLAHSPEWCAVIHQAYGHTPLYLAAEDAEGHVGLLPAFVVRRPFLGTAVTSMPFLDGGGPCSSSEDIGNALVAALTDEAHRVGASVVELRCTKRLGIDCTPAEHKVNLVLTLPSTAEQLWRQLDRGVRNQVRKAERSGLTVNFGGAEQLDAFYAMFAIRMRELGCPVHARTFFQAIAHHFRGQARFALVWRGPNPVGGLLAIGSRDTLTVPWASCLGEYRSLCSNMLLYWETIRTACSEGFTRFDFGRSSRGSGSYHFKRQWGAAEQPLFWYTIPVRGSAQSDPAEDCRMSTCLTKAWSHLPLTLTRRIGPRIRRYLIQ